MVYCRLFFLLAIFLTPIPALAHPVIYKHGKLLSTNLSLNRQDFRGSYSLNSRFALGINYSHLEANDQDQHYTWLQANRLIKRWNGESSQANIYLQAGLGAAFDDAQTQPLGYGEAQIDYETRRIYLALDQQSLISASDLTNHMTSATIGFAPYLTGFTGWHTWIIARGFFTPQMEETWSIAPGLRFFYRDFFAEVGSSLSGNVFLNLMVHF